MSEEGSRRIQRALGRDTERISVLLPAIAAAVTNLVLVVVAVAKGDSTVLVVAAIGALVATVLAMVADNSLRSARDLSERIDAVERARGESERNAGRLLTATTTEMQHVVASVGALAVKLEGLTPGSCVITREVFYENAIRLVGAPPPENRVVRVFNLFGNPPRTKSLDAQSRWFTLVSSEEFGAKQPPITFRRIKLVTDERSMQWTLQTLIDNANRRSFNMAVIPARGALTTSLAYPLNAHTYYDTDAFILLPSLSAQVSGPDGPVLHLTNSEEVSVLARYHDNLFAACGLSCEEGLIDSAEWRALADELEYKSPTTLRLLDELATLET
jgi:hypothetical protein